MDYAKRTRWVFEAALAIGLCLVVMASSASANWKVAGANITANQSVSVEKHSEHMTMSVPALNLEIVCNKLEGEGLVLLPGEAGEDEGKLKFSECITKVKGVEQKPCIPLGQPIVASGIGKLHLHKKRNYLWLLHRKEGEAFTVIKFNEETCSLPPENQIKGTLMWECLQLNASKTLEEKDCGTEEVTHIFREAPQALFKGQTEEGVTLPKVGVLFGANPATLVGSGTLKLSVTNVGKTFSGTI